MKNNLFKLAVFALLVLLFASCSTPKSRTYWKDIEYGARYNIRKAPELRFKPKDKLSIALLNDNPQLIAPFYRMSGVGENQDVNKAVSYEVDRDGNIDFPIIGLLHIEGMTEREVEKLLISKIQSSGYIKNPEVKVKLTGFSVIFVGAGGNKVLTVTESSLNIIEALSRFGDFVDRAKIKDLMVMRTEMGTMQAYSLNLKKKEIFNSPVFYLQQNDVIYTKPKGTKHSTNSQFVVSILGTLTSVATTVILYLNYIKKK
ncbi:MAG: polysaccharide biosynthesis/export family protein [Bacteroidales bacterium]|nr:polysaccharide biosynthesis/export family protein [Bacteroidales bacterium]